MSQQIPGDTPAASESWTFDQPMTFRPSDQMKEDLAEIFAAAPNLKAVCFYWTHSSYDRGEFFGSRGRVEPLLPEFRTSRQIADENPRLGALLRCLEEDYADAARLYDERDGGDSLLAATRAGWFFTIEYGEDLACDPSNLAERASEGDPGIALGISMATPGGECTAHDLIAGMEDFRQLFPELCRMLDAQFAGAG